MNNEIQPPNKIIGGTISAIFGAFIGIAVDSFVELPLSHIVLTAIFVIMCLITYRLFYWRIQANRIYKLSCKTNTDLKKENKDLEKENYKLQNQLAQEQSMSSTLANEVNDLRAEFSISANEESPSLRIKHNRDEYSDTSRLVQN